MTEENKESCNFQQNYNVFGLDDKPCCYLYYKYCDEIDDCYFKRCKRLEQENKQMKSALEEIREDIRSFYGCEDSLNDYKLVNMIEKINEVLNDGRE